MEPIYYKTWKKESYRYNLKREKNLEKWSENLFLIIDCVCVTSFVKIVSKNACWALELNIENYNGLDGRTDSLFAFLICIILYGENTNFSFSLRRYCCGFHFPLVDFNKLIILCTNGMKLMSCVYILHCRDHQNRMTIDHVHLFTACWLLLCWREESMHEKKGEKVDRKRGRKGKTVV